ncbi:MAG: hypothetical protein M3303_03785 [Gemmatimonadota bacterium]|nr:hypothetical protein [Gemmatimonadota bacterium]
MNIAVEVEPSAGTPPDVDYRWDPDTDILSCHLRPRAVGEGMSGAVELEGKDGSWLILDIASGRISGVEVAVWPNVQKRPVLAPPAAIEDARVVVPVRRSEGGVASVEINTHLVAEADNLEQVIHFRLGPARETRTVRLGRDLLIDLDRQSRIAGLWLLNVPPFPGNLDA